MRTRRKKNGAASKLLFLTRDQKREFTELRNLYFRVYKHPTPLTTEALDHIVRAVWILRICNNLSDNAFIEDAFATDNIDQPPPPPRWYANDKLTLVRSLKFLEELAAETSRSGIVLERFREGVVAYFEEDFWETLTVWQSADSISLALVEDMRNKAEMYGLSESEQEEKVKKAGIKYVSDPAEKKSMVLKLIASKRAHVLDIMRVMENGSNGSGQGPVDRLALLERYRTKRLREYYAAVRHYDELLTNCL